MVFRVVFHAQYNTACLAVGSGFQQQMYQIDLWNECHHTLQNHCLPLQMVACVCRTVQNPGYDVKELFYEVGQHSTLTMLCLGNVPPS